MDIYRPKDGVYRCINNPNNNRKYIMVEAEGCYPTLVPTADNTATGQGSNRPLHRTAVPVPCFIEEDNTKV